MTPRPIPSVQVLAADAGPEIVLVAASSPEAEQPGPRQAVDFGYSAGGELDDRVAALLATIAHVQDPAAAPAALVLIAPVTLDEQCAAAAYAVAGGVTLIVSDQCEAVERAVRVTSALQAHETVAEPVGP